MNAGKKFLEGVDAEMERMFPGSLARWNAVSAPEVPGGDDLDEVVDETAAWPVSGDEE